MLPVEWIHAAAVERLAPHHEDPFDRLLVAQAHEERVTLVTADRIFASDGVPILW